MVFLHLSENYPDELTADFVARYGSDWKNLGLWEAAALSWPLLSRPDYEICRTLNPDGWFWQDPIFNALAGIAGVKPPTSKPQKLDASSGGLQVMDTDQVDQALAGAWIPTEK